MLQTRLVLFQQHILLYLYQQLKQLPYLWNLFQLMRLHQLLLQQQSLFRRQQEFLPLVLRLEHFVGRQLEYRKVIADFKLCANSCWLSQKRTTSGRAIREAIKLLDVAEYFCQFHDEPTYRDDTFEFFYTKKQS